MTGEAAQDEQLFEDRRDRIRARYLKPNGSRPASSARGLHQMSIRLPREPRDMDGR